MIILVVLIFFPSIVEANDATIMLDIFNSLNLAPPSWSTQRNPCQWKGVDCNSFGQVTSISLPSSSISGTLPNTIIHLSKLQTLYLQNNNISGSIPTLASMTHLKEVFLNNNQFTHINSSFLFNLPSIETLNIDNNPIDPWNLPEKFTGLSSLRVFHASNVGLVGSIPNSFLSLPNLQEFIVSYNSLSGHLPPSLAGSRIRTLWINNQEDQGLSGSLDVLGHMPYLTQVWAQGNAFEGRIPNLSNCTGLFDLQIGDNRLYGTIPPSITSLPSLLNISLGNNMFQGPIPSFPSQVKVTLGSTHTYCSSVSSSPCDPQVTALLAIAEAFDYPEDIAQSWLGSDPCDNWIFVTCDSSRDKVIVLNFAWQNLRGFISPAFANLTTLTTIILSHNSLTGVIPKELTNLTMLQKLDVSNNNLTGKVPEFSSIVIVETHGNPLLGVDVKAFDPISPPPSFNNTDFLCETCDLPQISLWEITGIIGGSIILVLATLSLVLPFLKKKVKKYTLAKVSHDEKIKKLGESSNTYSNHQHIEMSISSQSEYSSSMIFDDPGNVIDIPIEVIHEATNNFSNENILGRGGFGVVYKGILHDGSIVAVKRMDPNSECRFVMAEFQSEIVVLSEVRHRNLLALLGYCVSKDERIMVYEYMSQGTLEQHLYEFKENGFPPLCWKQRLVIALDVARGVEYLHSLAHQSFIHRDLKPSNILLDQDMRAKVSDFGLVKNAPDNGNFTVETRLAGTFGYLAPEYATIGRVTTKIDVYSFGVVLMELITGRKALDERLPEGEAQLVTWFKRVILDPQENITKGVDIELQGEIDEILDSVSKVAELAGYCTAWEPDQRPDMGHVVNILAPLVDHWRPTKPPIGGPGPAIGVQLTHSISLPQTLQKWQVGESTTDSSGVRDNQSYHSTQSSIMGYNGFDVVVQDLSPDKDSSMSIQRA